MFPADFAYARARTLDEALDLLDEAHAAGQEAKLIAGGQSLLPMMKLRLAAPEVLIDIVGLPDLGGGGWMGSQAGGHLSYTISALATYRQLGRDPLLSGGLIRDRDETIPRTAPRASPPSPTPSRSSPTPRFAHGARSVARWRTPTRRPTSRRCCSPWTPKS